MKSLIRHKEDSPKQMNTSYASDPLRAVASVTRSNASVLQRSEELQVIQRVGVYEAFDNTVKLVGEHDEDITFGVELEVVHPTKASRDKAIDDARSKQLTDAVGLDSPVKAGKWSPQFDGSLKSRYGKPEDVAAEWVSPILTASERSWSEIETLCGILQDNDAEANDKCSEHIHVGHKLLEGNKEKFDGLFSLYTNFQDVIDVVAKGNFSGGKSQKPEEPEEAMDSEFRNGAEKYAMAMPTAKPSAGDNPELEMLTKCHAEVARTVDENTCKESIDIIDNVIAENEPANSDADVVFRLQDKINRQYKMFQQYINSLYKDDAENTVNEFKKIEYSKDLINDYKKSKKEKLRLVEKTIQILYEAILAYPMVCSYLEQFGGNPSSYDGRYRAVNIHQNLSDKRKPTVEFRRFNGTVYEQVIQANILLSVLLMKTSADQDPQKIQEFIDEYGETESIYSKAERLFEFITDGDERQMEILQLAFDSNV